MTATHPTPAPPADQAVKPLIDRLIGLLERRKYAALAVLTVIYFAGTVIHARSTLLWHDELYTVLLSRLSFSDLWRALCAGSDGHPPMINLLIKAVTKFVPEGEISLRIPSMTGFWVFCLCLFRFVNRRTGILYAFAALLLPFGTGAYYFATEARCYGPLLGFFGIGLICWQSAAEGRGRKWALPGLAISLACVILSHYYGSFVYAPFAAAELWRGLRRRRAGLPAFDAPMYAAFLAGLIPAIAYFPLAGNLEQFATYPWNPPHLQELYLYYKVELANELVSGVVFLALTALYLTFRRPLAAFGDLSDDAFHDSARPIRDYEMVAIVALAAMPAIALVPAFLITEAFSARYALTGVAGLVLMAVMTVSRLARGNRTIAAILLAASMLPFTFALTLHQGPLRTPRETEPLLREAIQNGPVAIDDGPLFLQTWYYLPSALKSRVYYLANPQAAAAISGSDAIDQNFIVAKPWMGFPSVDYKTAVTPGSTILLYHSQTIWSWLPTQLLRDRARLEILAADHDRNIIRATLPSR